MEHASLERVSPERARDGAGCGCAGASLRAARLTAALEPRSDPPVGSRFVNLGFLMIVFHRNNKEKQEGCSLDSGQQKEIVV